MTARLLCVYAAAMLAMAGHCGAQTGGKNAASLSGGGAPESAEKTCVQVQIAGQNAAPFACLNQELQDQALAASGQTPITQPLSAGSPSNAAGTFNQTAVAAQYGKNFGVSVMPYRPPQAVFNSSVH